MQPYHSNSPGPYGPPPPWRPGPGGAPRPPEAPAREPGTLEILEYMLRVAFFAAVPCVVVLLALLVPMGAAILNMMLALAAFFFGEMLRGASEKRPWLQRVFRRQL